MHINSFSSLAILVWSYGALEVQAAALRSGGYINSCNSLAYFKSTVNPKGWTIVGNCARSATDYNVDARIVIGTCIGNVGGKLVYLPGGAFGNSCSDVTFGGPEGSIMTAKCGDGNGLILTTQIDLNTVFGNGNGNLVC
ncbi:CVNH domain-containing protein [Elsinoe australis]|uniref:CVNH domain-containing protein n=1 Tax=Elsinoe australis TaxID=40998 RepID=A0A4U7B539_9PEZI|nr:CVNH domain-containing protein [Elsinoe australis]